MILVNWTYSTEEWKAFLRASKKTGNLYYRMVNYVITRKLRSAPTVSITPEKVWIGNDQQYFNSSRHELRNIDLRNEGTVNMLTITYRREGCSHEIKIPVPKGKLREAIEVQDRLYMAYCL